MARWKEPTFWVASVIIVAFAAFSVYMITKTDETDTSWSRLVYVYGGVEAIVFAAVGWVFGREVHRERAENAEKQAEKANEESNGARAEAERMTTKAQAMVVQANTERDGINRQTAGAGLDPKVEPFGGGASSTEPAVAALNRVADFANNLFREA